MENGKTCDFSGRRNKVEQLQKFDLDGKEDMAARRILDWWEKHTYPHYTVENSTPSNVTVSYSGGADSTVLLHLARKILGASPRNYTVKGVFVDTGLEYPEVRAHALATQDVVVIRPEMRFDEVVRKHGYPVVSKRVARYISDCQNPTARNEATRHLRMTGRTLAEGKSRPADAIPAKYRRLVDAPFRISDKCCSILKERPIERALSDLDARPMVGVMADESNRRKKDLVVHGCVTFGKHSMSKPLAYWTHQDVLQYLKKYNVPYASVYGNIVEVPGKTRRVIGRDGWVEEPLLRFTGEQRTGCMFCMFGASSEKSSNRFQRMAITHPKHHAYCMEKLGLRSVLGHLGVACDPSNEPVQIPLFEAS